MALVNYTIKTTDWSNSTWPNWEGHMQLDYKSGEIDGAVHLTRSGDSTTLTVNTHDAAVNTDEDPVYITGSIKVSGKSWAFVMKFLRGVSPYGNANRIVGHFTMRSWEDGVDGHLVWGQYLLGEVVEADTIVNFSDLE